MAPAGQLWSTAADLCRFAAFLAEGDERVLSAASVREMRTPAAPPEAGEWGQRATAWGCRCAGRRPHRSSGTTGSLPGFLAALWVSVDDESPRSRLPMSPPGRSPERSPPISYGSSPRPSRASRSPGGRCPRSTTELLELTGPWYWGTHSFGLRLLADRGVELQPLRGGGRGLALPRGAGRDLDRAWTAITRGRPCVSCGGEDGSVSHLDLGSFVFTREPYEPGTAVPGGVDEEGWRGLQL